MESKLLQGLNSSSEAEPDFMEPLGTVMILYQPGIETCSDSIE
jgi:hypothetical protein